MGQWNEVWCNLGVNVPQAKTTKNDTGENDKNDKGQEKRVKVHSLRFDAVVASLD